MPWVENDYFFEYRTIKTNFGSKEIRNPQPAIQNPQSSTIFAVQNRFMEYNKLVAVTGMPGLYELISSRADGGILRSLDDNKTQFVSSRTHNFSHLESIEIYTTGQNVNLIEIFKTMDEQGGALPDAKDNTAVKKYFEKTYPDMDFERVYPSDMKKIIKWYETLKKHKVEMKLSEPETEEEPVEVVEETEEEEKPKKKAAKKTADKPKATKSTASKSRKKKDE